MPQVRPLPGGEPLGFYLDAQLTAWRERPLGRCSYLVLDARYEKVRHR